MKSKRKQINQFKSCHQLPHLQQSMRNTGNKPFQLNKLRAHLKQNSHPLLETYLKNDVDGKRSNSKQKGSLSEKQYANLVDLITLSKLKIKEVEFEKTHNRKKSLLFMDYEEELKQEFGTYAFISNTQENQEKLKFNPVKMYEKTCSSQKHYWLASLPVIPIIKIKINTSQQNLCEDASNLDKISGEKMKDELILEQLGDNMIENGGEWIGNEEVGEGSGIGEVGHVLIAKNLELEVTQPSQSFFCSTVSSVHKWKQGNYLIDKWKEKYSIVQKHPGFNSEQPSDLKTTQTFQNINRPINAKELRNHFQLQDKSGKSHQTKIKFKKNIIKLTSLQNTIKQDSSKVTLNPEGLLKYKKIGEHQTKKKDQNHENIFDNDAIFERKTSKNDEYINKSNPLQTNDKIQIKMMYPCQEVIRNSEFEAVFSEPKEDLSTFSQPYNNTLQQEIMQKQKKKHTQNNHPLQAGTLLTTKMNLHDSKQLVQQRQSYIVSLKEKQKAKILESVIEAIPQRWEFQEEDQEEEHVKEYLKKELIEKNLHDELQAEGMEGLLASLV